MSVRVHYGTALLQVACCLVTHRLHFRAQPGRAAELRDWRDFVVITESDVISVSEKLSSVDFRPGSSHTDVLFIRQGEIWSGINTLFYSENYHNVLMLCLTSCLWSAACWVVGLCSGIWQNQKPCVSAEEGSGFPQQSRYAKQQRQWKHIHWLKWNLSVLLSWWNGDELNTHLVEMRGKENCLVGSPWETVHF